MSLYSLFPLTRRAPDKITDDGERVPLWVPLEDILVATPTGKFRVRPYVREGHGWGSLTFIEICSPRSLAHSSRMIRCPKRR